MTTAIYTLTSQLHDAAAVDAATQEFLGGLGIEYELMGDNFKMEHNKKAGTMTVHMPPTSYAIVKLK